MPGVFITGTGTDVGKTTISAALAMFMRKKGVNVGVMKPFATGKKIYSKKFKSKDTAILAKAANVTDPDEELNPFFYPIPASPLMAAELTNEAEVDILKTVLIFRSLAKKHDFLIVEGIGGVMVPLTRKESVLDFIRLVDLPVIIISESKLGTFNHTLLTIKACKYFGIEIVGIIINKMPRKPSVVEQKTPETIEKIGGIPVIAVIPFSKNSNYISIAKILEKSDRLRKIIDT